MILKFLRTPRRIGATQGGHPWPLNCLLPRAWPPAEGHTLLRPAFHPDEGDVNKLFHSRLSHVASFTISER